jgi:hypothetical protein
MNKRTIIKDGLAFLYEKHGLLCTSELEKMIDNYIITVELINNRNVRLSEGIIDKVGSTFHSKVTGWISLKNWTQTQYINKWGIWLQTTPKIKNEKQIKSITGVELLFIDNTYYMGHVGKISYHDANCEYCIIETANDWIDNYINGCERFEAIRMNFATRTALCKYPNLISKRFGQKILKELSSDLN